jgi:hypothetical protein
VATRKTAAVLQGNPQQTATLREIRRKIDPQIPRKSPFLRSASTHAHFPANSPVIVKEQIDTATIAETKIAVVPNAFF